MAWSQKLVHKFAVVWNRMLHRLRISEPAANQSISSNTSFDDLISTLNAIPDLMFELDHEGRHWDFRALRSEQLVAPPEKLLGQTVSDVMPPEAAKIVMDALRKTIREGHTQGTHVLLPTPIGKRWFEVSMARKEAGSGESLRVIVISRDITERKQKQQEAERLAYIDSLTELPNRHWLQDQLEQAVENSKNNGHYGALLFLDLDNFKTLNDTRGHDVGDTLLRVMAQRLRGSVRKGDLVARWGGDEFIVMIQKLGTDIEQAKALTTSVCDQIIARMNMPYELDGHQHRCQASIGINLFNGEQQDTAQIIKRADTAMYSAKQANRGHYEFFQHAIN